MPTVSRQWVLRRRPQGLIQDGDLELVDRTMREVLGPDVRYIVLHAAICRRELAIEIDGVHG